MMIRYDMLLYDYMIRVERDEKEIEKEKRRKYD